MKKGNLKLISGEKREEDENYKLNKCSSNKIFKLIKFYYFILSSLSDYRKIWLTISDIFYIQAEMWLGKWSNMSNSQPLAILLTLYIIQD